MLDNELIRKRFEESNYVVPSSYEKKINDTLKKIEKKDAIEMPIHVTRWWARNKIACAMILLLAVSLVSVSSYAAVDLLQERFVKMPKNIMNQYNEDVQKSSANADSYSRKLSKNEEKRMVRLRVAYEEKGQFPQKTLFEVTDDKEVSEGVLCFVSSESKFYLPERELTDEEILQIIDIQEKRAYSVQQKNKQKDADRKSSVKVSQPEEKERALSVVKSLYGREKSEFETISVAKQEELDEVVLQEEKEAFTVFITEENLVERVMYSVEKSSAHQMNVAFSEAQMKKVSAGMRKKVSTFSGKSIRSEEIYYQANESGNLAFGTVGYYYKLSDGSGCVAVYSVKYGEMYDIYVMKNYESIEKEINRKKKSAKKQGYTIKKVCK